ncbi:hypothetical protein ACLOJK_031706 [Asimina triloba]
MTISSPSSCSSSSYTNVARSHSSDNSIPASCIPKILRRLVCGSNISVQPSDFAEEAEDGFDAFSSEDKMHQPKMNASPPGLVARLMGLESMPVGEFSRTVPESIRRSRSVNSLLSWAEMLPDHRGVRASMSFREVPTFLRQENQDFLLLSFGKDDREEFLATGRGGRKSELGFGEVKEKRVDRGPRGMPKDGPRERRSKISEARNGDKPSRKARSESRPRKNETDRKQRRPVAMAAEERSQKQMHLKEMTTKKKNQRKKLDSAAKKSESECSSENSSPVSVLDRPFDVDPDFLADCNSHKSGRLRSSPSNSRRNLSSGLPNLEYPFLQICCKSSPSKAETKPSEEEGEVQRIKSHKGLCSSEVWHEICKLAEEDAKRANWVIKIRSRTEEFQEICVEFSVAIVDVILQEAIEELAEHSPIRIL